MKKKKWIVIDQEEPSDGNYFIAVDLAGFIDKTAIAVVKAHEGGWRVVEFKEVIEQGIKKVGTSDTHGFDVQSSSPTL